MKLKLDALDCGCWEKNGYSLPKFDIGAMRAKTETSPEWLHFGAGNIFRAFPAALCQQLLENGQAETGIVVCEGFDGEIIDKAYQPFDNLSLLVVLRADGTIEKRVIASVAESLRIDGARHEDWQRTCAIFETPSLKMASFTITEKGYAIAAPDGTTLRYIDADMNAGPDKSGSLIGMVTSLMLHRFNVGAYPISLVSMDNCSHNGEKLQKAVMAMANAWLEKGFVSKEFVEYLSDTKRVAFPWSMIDKITPRPDAKVAKMLTDSGYEDAETIITGKKTYTASFVNAEQAQYLVIEDAFPAGRPALENAGVYFVDRETVNKVEKMKVCTCLNPLHTALAILGCILGMDTIAQEMTDADLSALVKRIGYVEGLPVVVDPGIMKPADFLSDVLTIRLPNVFMPDTPQRIATDTSQKLSIRFGETIKEYIRRGMDLSELKGIRFVLAAYLRYLMAIGDDGKPFECSPDPLLTELQSQLKGIELGGTFCDCQLKPILENANIFGISLYEAGLADDVIAIFKKLIAGPGAVRTELHKVVTE